MKNSFLKNIPFERKVVGILIVVLIFVASSAVLVYVGLQRIISDVSEATRPDESLIVMKEMMYDISDAENSVKSYSLTKNSAYLNQFNEKTSSVKEKINELHEMAGTDQKRLDLIDSLDVLTDHKFSILEELLILQDKFKVDAVFDKVLANISNVELSGSNQSEANQQVEDTVKQSFFKRLFGKRKEKEVESKTEDVQDVKDDAEASLQELNKEVNVLKSEKLKEQEELRMQELEMIKEDKKIMQKISGIFHQLEIEEAREMEMKIAAADHRSNVTKNFVAAFCLLVCVLLFFAAQFIYKYVKRNNAYKRALKAAKDESEHKNREILDSIHYAKRIQSALLPDKKKVDACVPDSFIYYAPKDIVAGDFYWMVKLNKKTLIAVADCTGHGVPGAMVSVVCHNALNRSVREFGLTAPSEILEKTRELVIETLEEGGDNVSDGMDISLCSIDWNTGMVQYAGANNSLYLIKNNNLHEIKADKQPVGRYSKLKPFTNHVLQLEKGEQLFMFTDGFADQFGGPKGKKYKYKPFKKLLEEISVNELKMQKTQLQSEFNSWKGEMEQVDDLCVVGIRMN